MTPIARDVGVIIVAAGASTRAGGAELKQFRWIAGKPMLLHSVQRFQARADVAMVVCVLPRAYAADPPPWLFQSDIERLLVSVGGRERSESVANGLEDLPLECTTVVVHDAARPFAPDDLITRVVDQARGGRAAVPGLPIVDTVKRVDAQGIVVETVSRVRLMRIQTPQAFPRALLLRAHVAGRGAGTTDDAVLVERLGEPVVVVAGSELALKVTEEADFARAECLIGAVK